MIFHSSFLKTLAERKLVYQGTHLEALDTRLAFPDPIRAYIGFDLTAPSLHVGSLIQLMVMRWMITYGHEPIVLYGDATTRIGDPTGKDKARPMLSDEEIEKNRLGIQAAIDRVVAAHGYNRYPPLVPKSVHNMEWFGNSDISYLDFLREYAAHFSLNRMLTLDSVRTRLSRDQHMSVLEFNYAMMQAIDFQALFDTDRCILQVGGSDQWGNILAGVDLIQKTRNVEVYGLTTPLFTNAAGEKMGKTAGGAVWLDPKMTTPFDFWQFWRNVEDAKVFDYLRMFTELPVETIEEWQRDGIEINQAKIRLATEVTRIVHGDTHATKAEKAASEIASGGVPKELPSITVPENLICRTGGLAALLQRANWVRSLNEGRRAIEGKGVKINGEKVLDPSGNVPKEAYQDWSFVLTWSKRALLVKIEERSTHE